MQFAVSDLSCRYQLIATKRTATPPNVCRYTERNFNFTRSRVRAFYYLAKPHRVLATIQGKSAVLELPPLLTVEVVSTESVKRDYDKKLLEYAAFSIPEYWIVDPIEAKVTICLLTQERYNQTVFTGNQQIYSPTFTELKLTVQQVLTA